MLSTLDYLKLVANFVPSDNLKSLPPQILLSLLMAPLNTGLHDTLVFPIIFPPEDTLRRNNLMVKKLCSNNFVEIVMKLFGDNLTKIMRMLL